MTITAIEPKRKGLSALYIDGEFALKVDTETIFAHRIDVGDEIDDQTLKELIDSSDIKRAKDKAMWLISYRDYARKELIDKVSKDSSRDAAVKAVNRLEELGLINDERFARRYASDLLNIKHLSPIGTKRKLMEKGIERELAEAVIDELDCDIDENITTVIDRKYAKNLSDEKGRRRCINGLMRLGYSYSDIRSALNRYTDIEIND